jgi:phosphoribosyl 1,2-cyclic phosphodiesterase
MDFQPFYSSSHGNLYRLTDGDSSLLIECGVPFRQIREALDFDLSGVAGCLVSHSHADHSRAAANIMKAGIDVFCSIETADVLGLSGHRLRILRPMAPVSVGGLRVVAFPTEHDCDGAMGFLIAGPGGKLLFATDTYFIRPRLRGLTHIAIECNYSKETLAPDIDPAVKRRLLRSHMSLETCEAFLAAQDLTNVRGIWLVHLSDGNSDAVMFRRRIERATGVPAHVAPTSPTGHRA